MIELQSSDIDEKFGQRFESIVARNFIYNLIPPLILTCLALIVFGITYRGRFDLSVALAAVAIAFTHALLVGLCYKRFRSDRLTQAFNFVFCLAYLGVLIVSFQLSPENERAKGLMLLMFGASLVFSNKYLYLALVSICVTAILIAFRTANFPFDPRTIFYTCVAPPILGFFVCHFRQKMLAHLRQLFEEKKEDRNRLGRALAEARHQLTQRIESDTRLHHINRSFDRLTRVLPLVHWVRRNNRITFVSPAYEQIWESPCQQLYDDPNSFLAKVHPDDREQLMNAFQECFSTGVFDERYRLVMEDGRVKWIHARSFFDPLDSSSEYGIAEDISDAVRSENALLQKDQELSATSDTLKREMLARRKVEFENRKFREKLCIQQRLESLGLLAGGIAHDFNNILLAILINIDMLRMDAQQNVPPNVQRIDDLEKAAQRASDICRQMLQFSGKEPNETVEINLTDQIADSVQIMKSSLPADVELECRLPDYPTLTRGCSAQIQQLLLNLITNAREAVGSRGLIEIELETDSICRDTLKDAAIDIPEFDEGTHFHTITVRDNGCGMSNEVLSHLYDPFYSTKKNGRGLGLATVLGIVKGHRGTIIVHSAPGKGTEVQVMLPAATAQATSQSHIEVA